MSRTTVKSFTRAALKAAGLSRGRVEAGERADRRSDRVYTSNELHWHDLDAPCGDLFDVVTLTPGDLEGPKVFDLYVYEDDRDGGDLITNVCAVIDANGVLLDCFDSVSGPGFERVFWWLTGTECTCDQCTAHRAAP